MDFYFLDAFTCIGNCSFYDGMFVLEVFTYGYDMKDA